MLDMLGDAELAELIDDPEGRTMTHYEQQRSYFNKEQFAKDHPDLLNLYTSMRTNRVLRFIKSK